MRFTPTELTGDELVLQQEVREFLADELAPGTHEPGLGMSARHDKAFSKKMAERGWVGMALPTAWGGHDRNAVDRFVVVEEMLRWGAPVGWVAVTGDWQAPAMLWLYAGSVFWVIGYDTIYALQDIEDDALAGVKSSARRLGGAAWSGRHTTTFTTRFLTTMTLRGSRPASARCTAGSARAWLRAISSAASFGRVTVERSLPLT